LLLAPTGPGGRLAAYEFTRLAGVEVGEDQRDSLGVLVLDELGQLRGVGPFEVGEPHRGLQGLGEAVNDLAGGLWPKGLDQQLLGALDAALGVVGLGQGNIQEVKFEPCP
jgi:hypothetical protein